MMELFCKVDKDGSGILSPEEMEAAARADTELNIRAEVLSTLLIQWCKGNKEINYAKFCQAYYQNQN